MENQAKEPSIMLSAITVCVAIFVLMYSILFIGGDIQLPIIACIVIVGFISRYKLGVSYEKLEKGMCDSVLTVLPSIFILGIIGMLIGTWILGGIVPTLVYYGLQVLSPSYFLVAALVLSSIVSLATGSAWSTAGTVGVALVAIAEGIGIPVGIAAGAAISGAYFGDKLSPLSDTTNLAPACAGAKLFDHVKHMLYTTSITYAITFVLFAIIGLQYSATEMDASVFNGLIDTLNTNYNITPVLLIVPVIVLGMIACKVPAVPGLLAGSIFGGIAALIFQDCSLYDVLDALMYGVSSETGNEIIDSLLSKGGMQSMMWTVSLVMCALSFGGILKASGMINVVADKLLTRVKSTGSLTCLTVVSCFVTNLLCSDSYLAISLPAEMYKDEYKKRNLAPRNLSRILEDSGTVTAPLIPWNSCGATMIALLGVSAIEFVPFTFFCYLSPIVSIIAGYTGYSIMKLEDDPSSPEYVKKEKKKKKQ